MRQGMTRLDVVILLLCVLFVVLTIVLPGLEHTHESSDRVNCGSNLRQIGQALMLYANENHGQYPRTRWDKADPQVRFFTNPYAADPLGPDGPLANDVTASLYLLVRTQQLDPHLFICPCTDPPTDWYPGTTQPASLSNFPDASHLTYSFANSFCSAAVADGGFRWDWGMNPDLAIAADMNPGAPALKVNLDSSRSRMIDASSRNHLRGRGQGVLFAEGHVEFVETPFVGIGRDNVYSYGPVSASSGGLGTVGQPTSPGDSVLLPAATVDPGLRVSPEDRRHDIGRVLRAVWWLIVLGLAGGLAIHGGKRFGPPIIRFCSRALPAGMRFCAHLFRSRACRRIEKGLCPVCGYDLRATPDRCPECGTAFSSPGVIKT